MDNKLKDFIELFLFGFAIFNISMIVVLFFYNFFVYIYRGEILPFNFNLRLFFSFEILIVSLCIILGLIYINLFKKYKK